MTQQIDKYHGKMSEDALTVTGFDKYRNSLYHTEAVFYATQRKYRYAPVLGHDRLKYDLENNFPDMSDVRFMLHNDVEQFPMELLSEVTREGVGQVRTVRPGTIMFANQPIADIEGCFGTIQSQEISFEHAFDLPMTTAARAMEMVKAAGKNKVMDFSLRRDGDRHRAEDIARYAFIGGFDSTSNLAAAKRFLMKWVGTAAHYWQQAFSGRTWGGKHWQEVAFEYQLDNAGYDGTMLLLDTVSVRLGMLHAANAALSSPERLKAFRGFRIDSGEVGAEAVRVLRYFAEERGIDITNLTVALTGDMDKHSIEAATQLLDFHYPNQKIVFGVGTKLAAEVDKVAGIIFKLCQINGVPTLKCSENIDKSTLPGKLQVYRICSGQFGERRYEMDVVGFDDKEPKEVLDWLEANVGKPVRVLRLLKDFNHGHYPMQDNLPDVHELKKSVQIELKKFRDIENYKVIYSQELLDLKEQLIHEYREETQFGQNSDDGN